MEKDFEYKAYLPVVWAISKKLFGNDDADDRVHGLIKKLFNKQSLKTLTEDEYKTLTKYLKMLELEKETPLDFDKFGEKDYVERWIAKRCVELKRGGTIQPLKFLWALYGQFYTKDTDSVFFESFCWHVAHRIKILMSTCQQYLHPYNHTHKSMTREYLIRIGMISQKEGKHG